MVVLNTKVYASLIYNSNCVDSFRILLTEYLFSKDRTCENRLQMGCSSQVMKYEYMTQS